MEKAVIDFFNNLPEVLQESPALYVTAVCLAAGFGWRKMPIKYCPDTMLFPFVYTVGLLFSLSVVEPVARALGMGLIYASLSIGGYATAMAWLENKEQSLFGFKKAPVASELPDLRNYPPKPVIPPQDKINS